MNKLSEGTNISTEYSLWRATKRLKKPVTQFLPVREMNGFWSRDGAHKTNRLITYLQTDGDLGRKILIE